jgi:hypothetical protein
MGLHTCLGVVLCGRQFIIEEQKMFLIAVYNTVVLCYGIQRLTLAAHAFSAASSLHHSSTSVVHECLGYLADECDTMNPARFKLL